MLFVPFVANLPSTLLPIYEIETELITRLKTVRRLVLQAPTGSGKSTQVPQMLLKHGLLADGQVVILQPRRLAARLLASRVAAEMGVPVGREVGYQIRFENATSLRHASSSKRKEFCCGRCLTIRIFAAFRRSSSTNFTNAISMATSRSPAHSRSRKQSVPTCYCRHVGNPRRRGAGKISSALHHSVFAGTNLSRRSRVSAAASGQQCASGLGTGRRCICEYAPATEGDVLIFHAWWI